MPCLATLVKMGLNGRLLPKGQIRTMSVHQKKDGRWFVRSRDEDGKLINTYFGRGLDAEKKAREHNKSLGFGVRPYRKTPKQQSPFFHELVNGYTAAKMGKISEISLKNIMWKMDGIIHPTLGWKIKAINITPAKLDLYVQVRLGQGVKKTTVHRELSDIRAVLNWSVKRGYLTRNPAAGFEMPTKDDEIIKPPTQEEVNAILAKSPAHLTRALALSYYTGLRPGIELYSLAWTSLDCQSRSLLIISAKKNGRPSRLVPIHPNFYRILLRWYHDDIDDGYPDETTIVHFRDRPVRSIKKAFASAKENAGITRRLRPYDLRHAFASTILEAGGDLKSTSELLGHTRPDTTVRVYQHTNLAMHRSAVNRLPALAINGQNPKKKGLR